MSGQVSILDEEIQDFIDERLDRPARAAFSARLLARPELRDRVEAMRRQQRALRQIGQEVLYEPVPPRLRRILQQGGGGDGGGSRPQRRARICGLTTATAAILAGCVDGGSAF